MVELTAPAALDDRSMPITIEHVSGTVDPELLTTRMTSNRGGQEPQARSRMSHRSLLLD
jgi:hypothetical protein